MASLHRVELVPEDEPAPDGAAQVGDGSGRPPPVRRRPGRGVVGASAAAALALAVGIGTWVTTVGEQTRLATPGAVESLAVAPAPVWRVEATGTEVVPVGDALAVSTGRGVAGIDARTGERRWHVLDETARCGPAPGPGTGAAGPGSVTCLTGPARRPLARLLGPDGTASAPVDLGDALGRSVPAPDGAALRWARTGGVVHLVLQDARSGDVRWRRSLPPDDVERTSMCRPRVASLASVAVEDRLVVVRGCRVSAVLGLDGTRLDDAGEATTLDVVRLAEGTTVRSTSPRPGAEGRTELVSADGDVLDSARGRVLRPRAAGDGDDDVVVVARAHVVEAVETAPSTGPRALRGLWRLDAAVTQVAALADGVAVLVLEGRVLAVDARSGAQAWTWPPAGDPVDLSRGVLGAFTDGATVALVVPDAESARRARMVALALRDGSVRWDATYDADPRGFRAVGGRLVHVDPMTSHVVGYG
jgi:outer membrane protein assembly factor BamB